MTQYREAILEQIQKPNTHYSADQLYMKLKKRYPGISMATVYNHLHQLCEAGQIRRICVDGQPDRYDRMVRHDHLVCRKCGRLTDITLEDLTPSIQSQIHEAFESYDLQIYYVCEKCKDREKEESGHENGQLS